MKFFITLVIALACAGGLGYEHFNFQKTQKALAQTQTDVKTTQASLADLPRLSDLSPLTARQKAIADTLQKLAADEQQNAQAIAALNQEVAQMKQSGTQANAVISKLQGALTVAKSELTRAKEAAKKFAMSMKPVASRVAKDLAPLPEPPSFSIAGTEERGGETFAVIAPKGSTSLADTRLYRANDMIAGGVWQLKALDSTRAVVLNTQTGKSLVMPVGQ
jgi:hypothetical protein